MKIKKSLILSLTDVMTIASPGFPSILYLFVIFGSTSYSHKVVIKVRSTMHHEQLKFSEEIIYSTASISIYVHMG